MEQSLEARKAKAWDELKVLVENNQQFGTLARGKFGHVGEEFKSWVLCTMDSLLKDSNSPTKD